jgi:hypothetical protein
VPEGSGISSDRAKIRASEEVQNAIRGNARPRSLALHVLLTMRAGETARLRAEPDARNALTALPTLPSVDALPPVPADPALPLQRAL